MVWILIIFKMNELQEITLKDKVKIAEAFMKQMPMANAEHGGRIDLITHHLFSPGIYTRVLHIPKGCYLTGKIHKEPILNIMVKGDISVVIENDIKRIKDFIIFVSPAGSKKLGYAHEDTIWIGCHGTDEQDVYKIEKRFVTENEDELEQVKFLDLKQLELFKDC